MENNIKLNHIDDSNVVFLPIKWFIDNKPNKTYKGTSFSITKNIKYNDFIERLKEKYSFKSLINNYIIFEDNNCIINFHTNYDVKEINTKDRFVELISVYYIIEDFDIQKFYNDIVAPYVKMYEDLPKFNLISINAGNISTFKKELKAKIDFDVNFYNTSYNIQNIIDVIGNEEKSGLILLTGNPGTGKSYFIKYLTQIYKNIDFFYLPNNCLYILSDPNFINFCLNNLRNSILVIEDCESSLKSRINNSNSDISTILNITDGIIGDFLNIKVIATLNTVQNIDSALLRKGRMLANCEFKPLTIEQVKYTANKLNKNINVLNELCLCDIYNSEDNGVIKIKTKIGYK